MIELQIPDFAVKETVRKGTVETCQVLVQNVQAVQPLRSVQTVSRSSLPPPTRGKMKKGVERFELLERLEPAPKVNPSTSLQKSCTSRHAIDPPVESGFIAPQFYLLLGDLALLVSRLL